MLTIIEEAGWGVYPVLFNGFGMLVTAIVYAVVPKPRFLPLLAAFLLGTLMAGAMGTLRGIQSSVTLSRDAGGSLEKLVLWLPEDLYCLQIAIGLSMIGILATLIGAARFAAQRSEPRPPD